MPNPSYKRWVTNLVKTMSGRLNLQQWRIGLYFDEAYPEEHGEDCTAYADIDSRYQTAYIHFTAYAREMWEGGRMENLIECIVHELTHILINPLHDFARQAASPQTESQLTDILEQTTQRLTRIVIENTPKKIFSIN